LCSLFNSKIFNHENHRFIVAPDLRKHHRNSAKQPTAGHDQPAKPAKGTRVETRLCVGNPIATMQNKSTVRVSLSQICKTVGHDRLAARRFLQRRDILPDKEGRISFQEAKLLLEHITDRTTDADTRSKAQDTLKKMSGPYSEDWAKALNLSEQDPTIQDAQETNEINETATEEENKQEEEPQAKPMQKNLNIGMALLINPVTAMIFTAFALLGQAYLFAHLAHRTFAGINIPAPFWFHFIMALIFECTGILIAASFNDRKLGSKYDGISARSIWLFVFFAVQVISDLCLFGIIKNPAVGTFIVALAMPIALLGYANLYMEENRKA